MHFIIRIAINNEMPYNHSFKIWSQVQEEMSETATEWHTRFCFVQLTLMCSLKHDEAQLIGVSDTCKGFDMEGSAKRTVFIILSRHQSAGRRYNIQPANQFVGSV